jgi:hypothetical protein
MNSCDSLIFQKLCLETEFLIFDFHNSTGITPTDILSSIKRLSELQLLVVEENTIKRSENFKEVAINLRWKFVNRNKSWKEFNIDENNN